MRASERKARVFSTAESDTAALRLGAIHGAEAEDQGNLLQ